VKGGIFTLASGGSSRVWGPPGGFIEGNNEIGLAIIIVIPLLNYLRLVSTRRSVRLALIAAMMLSAVAAVGTQSRGAFLAIAAMALVLWWRSPRKLVMGSVLAAVTVGVLTFMPAAWEARMRTIETYEGDRSAMGRINAWQMAINLANDRITGGGFESYLPGIFARYAPNPNDLHAAHSIYFQVLGEHGWIGLALFCAIGAACFLQIRRIRRECVHRPELQWLYQLAGMIQVSMVGFAVGGAFLSLAYFDLPYNVLVILVACDRWMAEERWRTDRVGALGSVATPGRVTPTVRVMPIADAEAPVAGSSRVHGPPG
jgi:probable O-glycosylation ligase (exosortase A-associated)